MSRARRRLGSAFRARCRLAGHTWAQAARRQREGGDEVVYEVRAARMAASRVRLVTAAMRATWTRTFAWPKKRANRAPSHAMRAIWRSTTRRFLRSSR